MNWFNYNDVRFTRIKWSVFSLFIWFVWHFLDELLVLLYRRFFHHLQAKMGISICYKLTVCDCMLWLYAAPFYVFFVSLSVFQRAKCSTFYEMFRCVVSFSSLFRVVIRRLVVWWIYRKTKFVWWMIEIEHTLKRKLNEFAGKSML